MTMDYQERVRLEKAELDGRLDRLKAFIEDNQEFKTLPVQERQLLHRQYNVMCTLSDILELRIAEFK